MRSACLNTGPDFHLLDHIAPLAAILEIPLIIPEERNFQLAKTYYPQCQIRYLPDLEFQLGSIAQEFDALFECKYWNAHIKSVFRNLYQKEMKLIFCPHGQSDKGWNAPLLAPYACQDAVLVYGDLLLDMLKELQIPIAQYATIGNYRFSFYQKYKSFYDASFTLPLDRTKKTLLYAPTWNDADKATSFFRDSPALIKTLPSDWNLIIKPHPLLEQRDPGRFYAILAMIEKKKNIFLLDEYPPVYPILAQVDAYLGDASSVGYDFLAFQKPMYFLPTSHPTRLHACGHGIDPTQNIYAQLVPKDLQEEQKALYQLAFGPLKQLHEIKETITRLLEEE